MGIKECCQNFCRYLTLTVTKIFIGINALIFFVGALMLIGIGVYGHKQQVAIELNVNLQILIGSISVAILLFGNFIIALPIICYNDKIFSRLFSLMTFVFSIVFFVYGGLILKGRTYIYDYVDQQCNNPTGIFGNYDRIHAIAEHFACTSTCPCNATTSYWPESVASKMVTAADGINRITECQAYNDYVASESLNLDTTLQIVENYFNCSGICYKADFFFFTNISDLCSGYPLENCQTAIESFVDQKASQFSGACIFIGVLLFLGVIGSIVIIYFINYKHKLDALSQYKYEIQEDNII